MVPHLPNDQIEFITMRPPGSQSAVLDRQVKVTSPPEAVAAVESGDPAVLKELVELLAEPNYAWAAEVMLAAMTGNDGKMVDTFATSPDEWLDSAGKDAQARWTQWLQERRGNLKWDADRKMFVPAN